MNTTPTEKPEAIWLAYALEELDAQFTHRGMCGEAAAELRRQHAEIARLTAENEALRKKPAPLTDVEKHAMWVMATIDQCSHEQCYLRGIADSESVHGIGEKP